MNEYPNIFALEKINEYLDEWIYSSNIFEYLNIRPTLVYILHFAKLAVYVNYIILNNGILILNISIFPCNQGYITQYTPYENIEIVKMI